MHGVGLLSMDVSRILFDYFLVILAILYYYTEKANESY